MYVMMAWKVLFWLSLSRLSNVFGVSLAWLIVVMLLTSVSCNLLGSVLCLHVVYICMLDCLVWMLCLVMLYLAILDYVPSLSLIICLSINMDWLFGSDCVD